MPQVVVTPDEFTEQQPIWLGLHPLQQDRRDLSNLAHQLLSRVSREGHGHSRAGAQRAAWLLAWQHDHALLLELVQQIQALAALQSPRRPLPAQKLTHRVRQLGTTQVGIASHHLTDQLDLARPDPGAAERPSPFHFMRTIPKLGNLVQRNLQKLRRPQARYLPREGAGRIQTGS